MRWPTTLLLLCACLAGCHEGPPAAVAGPQGFRSFAIRNNSDLDSLARGVAAADTAQGMRLITIGKRAMVHGTVGLFLRDLREPGMKDASAEVLLVEEPNDGRAAQRRILGTYVRSKERQEILSVEWREPVLRIRAQAHWITEQDSLLQYHVAERTLFSEWRIAEGIDMVRQDTTLTLRDLKEGERAGAPLP